MNLNAELENIKSKPGMYLFEETYTAAASFIQGMDKGSNGGILAGFHEWMVVKRNGGNNLHWTRLVLDLLFEGKEPSDVLIYKTNQYKAIEGLVDLVLEFLSGKQSIGLRNIYLDYQDWLEEQSWYDEKSLEWRNKTNPHYPD